MSAFQLLQFYFNIPSSIDIKQSTWLQDYRPRQIGQIHVRRNTEHYKRPIFLTVHQYTGMLLFPTYFYELLSLVKSSKVRLNEPNYVPRQPVYRRRPVIQTRIVQYTANRSVVCVHVILSYQ